MLEKEVYSIFSRRSISLIVLPYCFRYPFVSLSFSLFQTGGNSIFCVILFKLVKAGHYKNRVRKSFHFRIYCARGFVLPASQGSGVGLRRFSSSVLSRRLFLLVRFRNRRGWIVSFYLKFIRACRKKCGRLRGTGRVWGEAFADSHKKSLSDLLQIVVHNHCVLFWICACTVVSLFILFFVFSECGFVRAFYGAISGFMRALTSTK